MKITILSIACMIFSSFAIQAQIPDVTVSSSLTDTDPKMELFLGYVDVNDDCRSIDVTHPISISNGIYDVNTITANGWWVSGGTPDLHPIDMKPGTSAYFTGAQITHICETGSYTPVNCLSGQIDWLRVWDYHYMTNCTPASHLNECLEYSSGCGGGASCYASQTIYASWTGGVNALLDLSH